MKINQLFAMLKFSEDSSDHVIDGIDVSQNGWTKRWGIKEIPDMLSEIGLLSINQVTIMRDHDEGLNVLMIYAF